MGDNPFGVIPSIDAIRNSRCQTLFMRQGGGPLPVSELYMIYSLPLELGRTRILDISNLTGLSPAAYSSDWRSVGVPEDPLCSRLLPRAPIEPMYLPRCSKMRSPPCKQIENPRGSVPVSVSRLLVTILNR